MPALSSDHNPILIESGDEMVAALAQDRFNLKKADWGKFQDYLDNHPDTTTISSVAELDQAVSTLTKNIQAAAEAAIPKSQNRRSDIYDLSPGLRQAVALKNRARREWQRHRTPDLKATYNKLCKILKKELSESQASKWDEAISKLRVQDQTVWRMSRALQRKKTTKSAAARHPPSGLQ
jgi:uncharacterized small protein (DUF1192 family)